MSSYVDQLKTHDLKCEESGITIKCTGNSELLEGRHGLVVETEEAYIGLNDTYPIEDYNQGNLFKNGFILSIGAINRSFKFIDRIRPEGFESKNCNAEVDKLSNEVKGFIEKYSSELSTPKIQHYNIGDGVTIATDHGSLFDLADPAVLTKNTEEVVKRIKISPELIREMIRDNKKGEEFFGLIKEQMTSLNCPYYTFERPDGEAILAKYSKFNKEVELRACGLRQKD